MDIFHPVKTSGKSDLILEDKEKIKIWICDMRCKQEIHIKPESKEQLKKHQQFEIKF